MTTVLARFISTFSLHFLLQALPSLEYLGRFISHKLFIFIPKCLFIEMFFCFDVLLTVNQVVPFTMFELQSKWVAGVLSGRIALPTKDEMLEDVKSWDLEVEAVGWPKRYTHNLSNIQVIHS